MEVHSVSLGKNFRLPTDCKPVRYSAHLAPDLAKDILEAVGERFKHGRTGALSASCANGYGNWC